MKKYFLCCLLSTLASIGLVIKANAVEDSANLTIAIKGIKNQKGQVCLRIYESESGFPLGNSSELKSQCMKITGNSLKQEFAGLKKGTYAIAVVDDQNGNNKLDRDFFGIPEEGFGISNNPTVSIKTGTPKFEKASFSLIQNQTIEIDMKYSLDP
ncbi:DUF2141 domain-containing protein [Calothrix sp. CCY 0018]|uniref:DUF2141 domain-containing protein n=1 Tax=Calothrix sp. CCY 0018 TaxID=3103864 RepID=UPI0039C69B16